MDLLSTIILLGLTVNLYSAQKSPCPRTFLFETNKAVEDRWFGVITLNSRVRLRELTLKIYFDKSVIQLGNYLARVQANSDNTVFTIKKEKEIKANTPERVRIYVVYDPYYDDPPPQITKITFNGKEICPGYEEQDISDFVSYVPSITINLQVPKCGTTIFISNGLITHGQNTVPGQYPWHTAIYVVHGRKRNYICGGSLISEKYIMTAAHCVTEKGTTILRNINSLEIILGKYGMYVNGKNEQIKKVSKIIVHPEFNSTSFFNDISIIEITPNAQITDYVKPICLWSDDTRLELIVNHIGIAVGWGMDHEGNRITDILMQAEMPVVGTLQCIFSNRDFFPKVTTEKNFCAGSGNGTSVCNGDSGGGLIFPKSGTSGVNTVWQLRGIVSNSIAKAGVCDPDYSVIFTDVAQYLDWIQKSIT